MLRRNLQTLIWRYDKFVTTLVAFLPASTHNLSVILGRMTLPSIWAIIVISISIINLQLGNTAWAIVGFLTVLSIPIGSLLKLLIRRERPKTIYAQNMKIKSYSFPSSHAYSATVAAGYIGLMSLALVASPLNYAIAAVCVALIAAVGISRIHVGAHYPTDVTAGWLLGAGILYILTSINI